MAAPIEEHGTFKIMLKPSLQEPLLPILMVQLLDHGLKKMAQYKQVSGLQMESQFLVKVVTQMLYAVMVIGWYSKLRSRVNGKQVTQVSPKTIYGLHSANSKLLQRLRFMVFGNLLMNMFSEDLLSLLTTTLTQVYLFQKMRMVQMWFTKVHGLLMVPPRLV
jgi:hypothetical protein